MKQISAATWDEITDDAFAVRRRPDGKIRRELCRTIATLKTKVGCNDFPTDVSALASEVGIREIRRVPLSNRGRLIRVPGGFDIEINESLDAAEHRFVVAHEVSHLLLDKLFGATNGVRVGYERTERLCDFGAREILLPLNTVRHELRPEPVPSLTSFVALAEAAGCSLGVVAQVVSELPGEWKNLMFIFCSSGATGLDVQAIIPSTGKRLELDDGNMCLARTALREHGLVRGKQSIWFDDKQIELCGEALALSSNAVAILTRAPAFLR